MDVYLTDTNILIGSIRGRADRFALLDEIVSSGGLLACSVITVGELYSGMRGHEKARTERLLKEMIQYEVTLEIARLAGDLKNRWASRGRTLSLLDTLIAATAIVHDLILVTSNVKDFPMPELHLYPAR